MAIVRFLVAAALAVPLASRGFADGELPTNRILISCMPPETESVFVRRLAALRGDAALKDNQLCESQVPERFHDPKPGGLLAVVLTEIAGANPQIHAEGGSGFTYAIADAKQGVGLGTYKRRSIWRVERSLAGLRDRLVSRREVEGNLDFTRLGEVTVFGTDCTQYEIRDGKHVAASGRLFVSIPTDHMVLLTQDRDEMEFMLRRLKSPAEDRDDRWTPFTVGLDIEAPVLILRRFVAPSALDYNAPCNPRDIYPGTDIDGFGLVLVSLSDLSMDLRCIAREPEKAAAYFVATSLDPESFAYTPNMEAGGFVVRIKPTDERGRTDLFLVLYILYGPNLFI